MKYVKILGLLAVAAAAMMAFAASASATTITSPTGTVYTNTIEATVETGGHAVLQNPIAKVECHGYVKGTVESHGPGATAKGKITSLLWGTHGNLNGNCTNSWHVTTVATGELEIHWKAEHEGTLTSNGAKVDTTRFGVTCVYETKNTPIGTFTDSHATGSTENGMTKTETPGMPTMHISAEIPLNDPESGALCGTGSAKWEGAYTIETPGELFIDKE